MKRNILIAVLILFNVMLFTGCKENTEKDLSSEKIYYDFIKNELAEKYGISDLAGFKNLGDKSLINDIPEETQGIISAVIQDFNNDDKKELLIIYQKEHDYMIECYDSSFELLDTYNAGSFNERKGLSLDVSMISDRIVIKNSWIIAPGFSAYGNNISVLSLYNNKFNEDIVFGGARHPGYEHLYINDEDLHASESDGLDYDYVSGRISEELNKLNIKSKNIVTGWGVDINYGVQADFEDSNLVMEDYYNNGLDFFRDYTGLRDNF